jgi:hypothetical protein
MKQDPGLRIALFPGLGFPPLAPILANRLATDVE